MFKPLVGRCWMWSLICMCFKDSCLNTLIYNIYIYTYCSLIHGWKWSETSFTINLHFLLKKSNLVFLNVFLFAMHSEVKQINTIHYIT